MKGRGEEASAASWRAAMHEIIFEADTPSGKLFDLALLVAIGELKWQSAAWRSS